MAVAKTKDKMVTRSIYIKERLYNRLQQASKRVGASIVIEYLVKEWLDGKVDIAIKPEEIITEEIISGRS